MEDNKEILIQILDDYRKSGISDQVDYDKFYLYSMITHSTAIEGSTVTEIENQLLFDEGISAKGRSIIEQMMNLDLKHAYETSMSLAREHAPFSVGMLKGLSSVLMKNTGSQYNTLQGSFDSSKGDLRLVNVTAGVGGKSYMSYQKVPSRLEEFCRIINERRKALKKTDDVIARYLLSFDAHYLLVTIHPWVDGNGRMSRLIMNHLQFEYGLVPVKIDKEDKSAYIQALVDSREQESLEPFRNFMIGEHIKNLRTELENYRSSVQDDPIKLASATVDAISDPINKISDPINRRLFNLIRQNSGWTYSRYAEELGVSEATVKRRIGELKKAGVIRREGSNKTGHWIV